MERLTYKTILAEPKPYYSATKDRYLNYLADNKHRLYTGAIGIYLSREVLLNDQHLYYPFIDIDADKGITGDDAIASSIANASLTLATLRKLQADYHFTPIATGGSGFRLYSHILLNYDDYRAFSELVKFEMPHIHDMQPTDELNMPHQLFAYKGNSVQNKKSLIDRHSEIVPASIFFNNEMTVKEYKHITAGKPDPDATIDAMERLLNFRPISDLSALGDFGKKLMDYKEIIKEQKKNNFHLSCFRRRKKSSITFEVLCEWLKEKGIKFRQERRGKTDALSFTNLPCPMCGDRGANAVAYPPHFTLNCFNTDCPANKGLSLYKWSGISEDKSRKPVSAVPAAEIQYDDLSESSNKILTELDSNNSSLIVVTPGAGKTHIAIGHFTGQADTKLILYCCSSKKLKKEAYDKALQLNINTSSIHMLNARDELCLKPDELTHIVGNGYRPSEILCPSCEHKENCPYYSQRQQIQPKGMYFLTQNMLQYISDLIPSPDVIILDEDIMGGFRIEDRCTETQMLTLSRVLDDKEFRLIEKILSICRNISFRMIRDNEKHPLIVPVRAMDRSSDYLLAVLSRITDKTEQDIQDQVQQILNKIDSFSPHALYRKGIDLKAVEWLKGFLNNNIFSCIFISKNGDMSLVRKHLNQIQYKDVPVKLLDATGDEAVARAIAGRDIVTVRSDIKWNCNTVHIKATLSRQLMGSAKDKDLRKILELAIKDIKADKVMLATYQNQTKRVLKICIEIDPSKQYKAYHFHGPRGVNEYIECDAVIVLGLPYPNLGGAYHDACMIFPDDNDRDKRDAWAESAMLSELIQGIHRIRPIRKEMTELILVSQFWPNILPAPDAVIDLSHDKNWKEVAIERLEPLVREFGFLNQDIGFLANVIVKGKEKVAAKIRDRVLLLLSDYEDYKNTYNASSTFSYRNDMEGKDTIDKNYYLRKYIFDIRIIYIRNILGDDFIKRINFYFASDNSNPIFLPNASQWHELVRYFKEQYQHYEAFELKLPHSRNNAVRGVGVKNQVIEFYKGTHRAGITDNIDFDSYRSVQNKLSALVPIPEDVTIAYYDKSTFHIFKDGAVSAIDINRSVEMSGIVSRYFEKTIITNDGKALAKLFISSGIYNCSIHDITIAEKVLRNGDDLPKTISTEQLFEYYDLKTNPDTLMAISQFYQIWQEQQSKIDDMKLRPIVELEMKVLWPVAKMELQGIGIDVNRMLGFYYQQRQEGSIKQEIERILPLVSDDDCIHDNINQIGTVTGRFTDTTQTIKRELKQFFKAREGYVLIKEDYRTFEPRIIAALSGDADFKRVIDSGRDVYEEVAEIITGGNMSIDRATAKAIVLGVYYGQSAYSIYEKLKKDSAITLEDVKDFVGRYKAAFTGIFAYRDQVAIDAQDKERIRTAQGRHMKVARDTKTTTLFNYPIQATGADIFKKALVDIDDALEGMDAKIVFTLHDEIWIEAREEDRDAVLAIVRGCMDKAMQCIVVENAENLSCVS